MTARTMILFFAGESGCTMGRRALYLAAGWRKCVTLPSAIEYQRQAEQLYNVKRVTVMVVMARSPTLKV